MTDTVKSEINIYTDGSAIGNPGPGGLGIVIECEGETSIFSSGYKHTTNNRMELLAVIEALSLITADTTGYRVRIYTDSKYVIDPIVKGWIHGWIKNGFKNKKNSDLWLRFLPLYRKFTPDLIWVKGHSGHPQNELCDEIAYKAASENPALVDYVYAELCR